MKVELVARSIPYNDEGMTSVCAEAAAICTASNNKGASLKGAMASQHWSVLEHASFTFRISGVSRVLLAQLTRHRIASFSVESQRYVDQSKSGCIIPPAMTDDPKVIAFIKMAGKLYDELVEDGISKEDARYILPMGGETQLIMTMNARELRHFLSLRMCNRAQWEIRKLADLIYGLVMKEAPELFALAGPSCVRGKCKEGRRSCGVPRVL